MSATATTPVGYADASIERVTAGNAIEYAYRDLGEGDVPLVLLQHVRGNLDNWDPALVDALAADRRVVTFDNVGVGATTGRTPNTVEAMAHGAIAHLGALDRVARRRLGDRRTRQHDLRHRRVGSGSNQQRRNVSEILLHAARSDEEMIDRLAG